ncbi:MAG: acetate kinase [Alteromonadaceae bacterium]|nr:acetate kinase [Alteromonadaceae bacterium]
MADTYLVVNCGSSSVKLALYDDQASTLIATALAENLGFDKARLRIAFPQESTEDLAVDAGHQQAIETCISRFRESGWLEGDPAGIGHRVVHGGERFRASVLIEPTVVRAIEECAALAPLHNPANLTGIHQLSRIFPRTPQVAVFDTAFHQSLPEHAFLYALPYRLYQDEGVRRYGFHGTSHRYILQQLAADLDKPEGETSLISAHLGNGCSICAIRDGQSVDTSMGLTPLEGLVMGTRSGDIDPGLFDFLAAKGIEARETHRMLNRESGLLGISGHTNDMRELTRLDEQGDQGASRAIEVFCFRLARYIGAMLASVNCPDALVFTGGIGENSATVRARTLSHLQGLGFDLDAQANNTHGRDSAGEIQLSGSRMIKVIRTNEELVIARDTHHLTVNETSSVSPATRAHGR